MVKKRTTTYTKPADKTKFIMKAKQPQCQKSNLTVDFKPTRKDQLYKEFKGIGLFPIFNNDKKYFTPTFVLRFFDNLESDEELKNLHEKKLTEYTTQIDAERILFPKPRSKNKYCGVCKDTYEDYYNHVHSQQHRQQSRTSRYTKYINQLCIKFNPHLEKQQKRQIETELQELMFKYKSEDNYYAATSYETVYNGKRRHQADAQLKKESSLSYSNNNNRTTIILSSD